MQHGGSVVERSLCIAESAGSNFEPVLNVALCVKALYAADTCYIESDAARTCQRLLW